MPDSEYLIKTETLTAIADAIREKTSVSTRTYANSYEQNNQMQYEYYSAGNSKVKKRHGSTSTSAYWWERSPYYHSSTNFCRVNTSGSASYFDAYSSSGVAPAFLI